MATPTRHRVERLRYWQGQALRARDFRDQAGIDAIRRQLHNRALHATGGVALGLKVDRIDGDASRLRVSCGLAYDCRGRELLLQQPREVAVPKEPSWLFLRLRADGAGHGCGCAGDPGCAPPSASMLDDVMELAWMPLQSLERLEGVAIARYLADLDPAFRAPQARPLARPRLARGRTVRGNTPWEPWIVDQADGQGGVVKRVVGVQTRIDTSASGFTQTPCYLATLDAPAWDVATAEFAPAFFPHVADPSIDGFTFRLLMVETTRRRYAAAAGVTRVTATSRGVGDGLQIDVADPARLQKGDPIALLRPRARSIVRAKPGTGATITLGAALDGIKAGETLLAVGNLPRTAVVADVETVAATAVAVFQATPAIRKGDVLLRASDGAMAVIASVSNARKELTVKNPFTAWAKTDVVRVARLSKGVTVSTADPGGVQLVLTPATHAIGTTLPVVLIDGDGMPLGGARTVTTRTGAAIDVSPALSAAEIAGVEKVAVFTADLAIKNVDVKSPGIEVEVDTTAPFEEDDFVAIAANPRAIASVRRVTSSTKLVLDTAIPMAVGDVLVAANWLGATTVARVAPGAPTAVTVGRTNAVPVDAFVARRAADDSLSTPAIVDAVNGPLLTLHEAIPDLARLDTLAIGAFPRVVTVLAQQPDETQIQLVPADAGLLAAGDEVALLGGTSAKVAQVSSASGGTVVLGESIGTLAAGQKLGVVHFRDQALVTAVNSPTNLTIDPDLELRAEREIAGVLTHYVDHSNPGLVDRITGSQVALAPPTLEAGDGLVDAGWIDGGLVGPASLSFSPFDPAPEWRLQPIVRLVSTEGLEQFQQVVIFGLDLVSGRPLVSSVIAFVFGAGGHAYVWATEPGIRFRYRPETLSLITTFNTDFPKAFATFAQKQQLSVSWLACQGGFPRPTACPGQEPYDVCADTASGEA